MGCNCGGSTAAPGSAERGPNAPGYTWDGPQKRAEQTAAKAAKRTKTPPKSK